MTLRILRLGDPRDPEEGTGSVRCVVRRFKAEMSVPTASRALDLLTALSHNANLSIGCYCENDTRCHRSLLRELLMVLGANLR